MLRWPGWVSSTCSRTGCARISSAVSWCRCWNRGGRGLPALICTIPGASWCPRPCGHSWIGSQRPSAQLERRFASEKARQFDRLSTSGVKPHLDPAPSRPRCPVWRAPGVQFGMEQMSSLRGIRSEVAGPPVAVERARFRAPTIARKPEHKITGTWK